MYLDLWRQCEGQPLNQAVVLGACLGGSEYSAVFQGESSEGQKAAVKLIPLDPEHAGTELCRLDAAAKLSHPNLLRLFDWGLCRKQDQHLLYIVMEYAPENLAQVLPERPLTPVETLEVLTSSLDAIEYLHRQGFVHGRLKPSNIFAVDERVKISIDRLCRAGGTVTVPVPSAYSPPEARRGEMLPAGDVWMLALTMVEMLSQQVTSGEGQDWDKTVLARLPHPFRDIAHHCLQQSPRRRWPVDWVKARLTADPATADEHASESERIKVSKPILSLAAAGLAFVALLTGSAWLLSRPGKVYHAPTQLSALPIASEADRSSPPGAQGSGRAIRQTGAADVAESLLPQTGNGASGVVKRVLPNVSAKIRSTIRGKVLIGVEVEVDRTGSVIAAKYESPGVNEDFFDLALPAVRNWKFSTAAPKDTGIARTWVLRFEFRRNGVAVQPVRVAENTAAR